jgi:Oxidoreductase family, C-terminal alpha/beta domain
MFWPTPSSARVLALGYQRRRENHFRWIRQQIDNGLFGKLVNAEANISRDRLGKIDLASWRYQAKGMPGGVMLQIGIHYIDVLEYLIGPIRAVRGQLAQLVLPGDNPDVASLMPGADEKLSAVRRGCDLELMRAIEIFVGRAVGLDDVFGQQVQHPLVVRLRPVGGEQVIKAAIFADDDDDMLDRRCGLDGIKCEYWSACRRQRHELPRTGMWQDRRAGSGLSMALP